MAALWLSVSVVGILTVASFAGAGLVGGAVLTAWLAGIWLLGVAVGKARWGDVPRPGLHRMPCPGLPGREDWPVGTRWVCECGAEWKLDRPGYTRQWVPVGSRLNRNRWAPHPARLEHIRRLERELGIRDVS